MIWDTMFRNLMHLQLILQKQVAPICSFASGHAIGNVANSTQGLSDAQPQKEGYDYLNSS